MTQAGRWLSLRAPRQHPESDLQRRVAQWWAAQYPKTWMLTFHCPSGVALDAKRGAIFKGLGWKRGIPDLLCLARLGGYSGLAIELKADAKAKPSLDQLLWLEGLEAQGYVCKVVSDLFTAMQVIHLYHGKEP